MSRFLLLLSIVIIIVIRTPSVQSQDDYQKNIVATIKTLGAVQPHFLTDIIPTVRLYGGPNSVALVLNGGWGTDHCQIGTDPAVLKVINTRPDFLTHESVDGSFSTSDPSYCMCKSIAYFNSTTDKIVIPDTGIINIMKRACYGKCNCCDDHPPAWMAPCPSPPAVQAPAPTTSSVAVGPAKVIMYMEAGDTTSSTVIFQGPDSRSVSGVVSSSPNPQSGGSPPVSTPAPVPARKNATNVACRETVPSGYLTAMTMILATAILTFPIFIF